VPVANFTLAVDRPYLNQQGERETDFIRISLWRKLAETCANHLGKGRLVAVEGRLQVRSYETPEGQRRQVTEVVAEDVRFLDWPKDRTAGSGNQDMDDFSDFGDLGTEVEMGEDELPF